MLPWLYDTVLPGGENQFYKSKCSWNYMLLDLLFRLWIWVFCTGHYIIFVSVQAIYTSWKYFLGYSGYKILWNIYFLWKWLGWNSLDFVWVSTSLMFIEVTWFFQAFNGTLRKLLNKVNGSPEPHPPPPGLHRRLKISCYFKEEQRSAVLKNFKKNIFDA